MKCFLMKKKPAKQKWQYFSAGFHCMTVTCVYGYHRASRWFKHSTVLNIHDRYKLEFVAHHWRSLLLLIGLDEVLVKLHAVLWTSKQTHYSSVPLPRQLPSERASELKWNLRSVWFRTFVLEKLLCNGSFPEFTWLCS